MKEAMYHIKCENCGADIPVIAGRMDMRCEYCGSIFPVPEEMMEKASQTKKYREEQKYRTQTDALMRGIDACFIADSKRWKLALILWIVLSCLFMTSSSMVSHLFVEEFSISFFMFGMSYVIAAKPKRFYYQSFDSLEKLTDFQKYAKRWRSFFLLWVVVISVLFGIGEYINNDLGTGAMLGGIFLLTYLRPSKRLKKLSPQNTKTKQTQKIAKM